MSDEVENEETVEEPQEPKWEKRPFAINESMKQVLKATQKATESEITRLRKRLNKLQYGG